MRHPSPNRQGLLAPGCKDLIDHLPLGAENSDVLRDPTDLKEIGMFFNRAMSHMKEGHFEKGMDMIRTAAEALPDYLVPIYPTCQCGETDKQLTGQKAGGGEQQTPKI